MKDNQTRIKEFFQDQENYERIKDLNTFFTSDVELAKDATQDLFERMWSKAENFSLPAEPKAAMNYVRKAAKNLFFEGLRSKMNGRVVEEVSEKTSDDVRIHRSLIALERLKELDMWMRKRQLLTPQQNKLWECLYNGLSVKEIQEKLKIADGQKVHGLKHKLVKKIKKALREWGKKL